MDTKVGEHRSMCPPNNERRRANQQQITMRRCDLECRDLGERTYLRQLIASNGVVFTDPRTKNYG